MEQNLYLEELNNNSKIENSGPSTLFNNSCLKINIQAKYRKIIAIKFDRELKL